MKRNQLELKANKILKCRRCKNNNTEICGTCLQNPKFTNNYLPTTVKRNKDRDVEILEMRESGAKFTDIGNKYGISGQRASEIYRREKRKAHIRKLKVETK